MAWTGTVLTLLPGPSAVGTIAWDHYIDPPAAQASCNTKLLETTTLLQDGEGNFLLKHLDPKVDQLCYPGAEKDLIQGYLSSHPH